MSKLLSGIAASGGIVIAPVHLLGDAKGPVEQQITTDVNHEVERLHDSFRITTDELTQISRQASANYGNEVQETLQTQLALINDWQFQAALSRRVVSEKITAASAVQAYLDEQAGLTPSRAQQARLTSLQDVGHRLLGHLLDRPTMPRLDHRAVIVAHQVSPSLVASFDPRLVAGVVTDQGGATAHSALLVAELGLPAVVGTHSATTQAAEDMVAIVDGEHGKLILQPTPQEIDHYQRLAAQYQRKQQELGALATATTVTADGSRYQIAANVTLPAELKQLAQAGAEGIGLYRSEYLFLDPARPVTEEEQVAAYKAALLAMPKHRVVIRVQDLGADKQPGANLVTDRGIRRLLAEPVILRTQLRALLRASVYGQLAIMFPFVATIDEFQRALAILDQEKRKLVAAGHPVAEQLEVGMMIETPAAVLMADQFAKYADFFSIGSNDLVQYLFATERTTSPLNHHYSVLNPAVLRAIRQVIQAAHAEGKWISLCGEMATVKLAQPLLLAMGLDEFSVPLAAILPLRQLIRSLSVRQLQPLVKKALALENDDEVAELVEAWLAKQAPQAGLKQPD